MKLGDIKLEALQLMIHAGPLDIGADQLADYLDDETIGYYLSRMPGAINRALSIIERRRVLPVRSFALVADGKDGAARFDLRALIADFYDVERVLKIDANDYWWKGGGSKPPPYEIVMADFRREGDVLSLPDYDSEASYTLLYRPSVRRVSAGTPDTVELALPNEVACLIPYAIKGELFVGDDADEAEAARARFEYGLDEIRAMRAHEYVGTVKTVYGGGMME